MISIASLLVFFAFYTLYNTSQKAYLSNTLTVEKWLQNNPKPSKFIGLALLAFSFSILLIDKAIGSSTLIFTILIMSFGSLTVILAPLKIISNKLLFALFTISIFIELYY
ncbi:MAG: hypothetical protein B7Y83_07310 [Flavobacteriales bacterium 32-34-25]|nr:MAG: hypothetical protein B7Y83_07310 [Flavobacteriales bacterium 32-34-25]